jgi:pilus assembly protein FimV
MFTAGAEAGSEVHSTEVDPIAEAEVYIAYGREAQAEEILREALKKQPERQAIRMKLLEIFASRKDAQAFSAVAREMYEMTGGHNEEWPKVVTLGLSVDPDNPLYTGLGPDEPHPASAPEGTAGAAGHAQDVPELDFDLDLDSALGKAASTASRPADSFEGADTELARAVRGRFDLPDLSLNPSADTGATQDAGRGAAELPGLPSIDQPETQSAQMTAGGDTQAGGFAATTSGEGARWQEMATKLDLAAAYEEIGDKEGARELLQEVLQGGDAGQQEQARAMIAKLA